jgi:hypothetical protein
MKYNIGIVIENEAKKKRQESSRKVGDGGS